MTSPEPAAPEPQALFKAGKKRKIYRQRAQEPEETSITADNNPVAASAPAPPEAPSAPLRNPEENDEEEEGLSVAEAIRRRNARKHKLGGVGFHARTLASNDTSDAVAEENTEQGMVLHDAESALKAQHEAEMAGGISTRFAPQTGLVGELVNKNMEEYIESELARRKRLAAAAAAAQQQQQDGGNPGDRRDGSGNPLKFDPTLPASGSVPVESQRVLQGRLMEIDLGEEARARTAAMTERARRRLQGEDVRDEEENDSQPKKVRLGPDGKPWRPRNRRGSDDIKRDQLVEEFLSENRVDMSYITAEESGYGQDGGEEELGADERIAEEFRRQFMDAASQRHRRRKPAINAKPSVKQHNEEYLRGPKLGGSRNARAAVRDALLREQEMKKKR